MLKNVSRLNKVSQLNTVSVVGELACHPFECREGGRRCLRLRLELPRRSRRGRLAPPAPIPIFVFDPLARTLDALRPRDRIAILGRLREIEPELYGWPPVRLLGVEALDVDFLRFGPAKTTLRPIGSGYNRGRRDSLERLA